MTGDRYPAAESTFDFRLSTYDLSDSTRHGVVLGRVETRQVLDERDDRPELVLAEPHAPGRHARHLEAVLRRPVDLGGAPLARGLHEVVRRRHQRLADVMGRNARRAVALQAGVAMQREAAMDQRGIGKLRRRDVARTALHRVAHGEFQRPVDGRGVLLGGGDVVEAADSDGGRGQRASSSEDGERGEHRPACAVPRMAQFPVPVMG